MNRFKWIATALTLTLLALPGAALAGGGAAGDQYTEQVPNAAGGNGGNGDVDGSSSLLGRRHLSSATRARPRPAPANGGPLNSKSVNKFEKKGGSDGAAAANLAGKTAPDSQALTTPPPPPRTARRARASSTLRVPPRAPTTAWESALPIILALILLGGLGYAWFRRRGDSDDGPPVDRQEADARSSAARASRARIALRVRRREGGVSAALTSLSFAPVAGLAAPRRHVLPRSHRQLPRRLLPRWRRRPPTPPARSRSASPMTPCTAGPRAPSG